MDKEPRGTRYVEGFEFSLYQTSLANGRDHYLAEIAYQEGRLAVVDHWNLEALRRQISQVIPVIALARKINGFGHRE